MSNYKLVPVTFSVCGYMRIYDKPTLEDANKFVMDDPENFAPVDAAGKFSIRDMDVDSLQYIEGTMDVSFKEPEELRAHKAFMLMHALYDDEAVINVKTNTVYIPDITIEPFWFHGFNVKTLREDEIKEALADCKAYPLSRYCIEMFPAAGTIAPNRLDWIPLDLKADDDIAVVRTEILDFLNNLPDENIDNMMAESEFVLWRERTCK